MLHEITVDCKVSVDNALSLDANIIASVERAHTWLFP